MLPAASDQTLGHHALEDGAHLHGLQIAGPGHGCRDFLGGKFVAKVIAQGMDDAGLYGACVLILGASHGHVSLFHKVNLW